MVYHPEAQNDWILTVIGSPWGMLAIWLLGINLVTFFVFGIDKWKAKRGSWRISEKALLMSAFCFGGIGAFLGMRVFHHKTKHWYFQVFVPLFMILQIAIVIAVVILAK